MLLLFLLLYALDQGERGGTFYGLGIGALLDVVTFSYFGWHMVTRAFIGYVVGKNRLNMFADRLPTYLILTFMVTLLLRVATSLFLCFMQGRWLPFLAVFGADGEKYRLESDLCPGHVVFVPQAETTAPQSDGLLLSSVGETLC